jgi:hypothetical protein
VPGVVDRRLDLAAVPDDPGVLEQARDVARVVAGHPLRIEAVEGFPEVFALAKDRDPAQARLEALEADLLEQAMVVADRPAPFFVVIAHVERIGSRPPAAHAAVRPGDQPGVFVRDLRSRSRGQRDLARRRGRIARRTSSGCDDAQAGIPAHVGLMLTPQVT